MNTIYHRRIIIEFEPLLHKTIQSLGISLSHINYEDYLQELRIKLLEIASDYEGKPLGEDRYRFTAYAKQGLRWYLLDFLRKANKAKLVTFERFDEWMDLHNIDPEDWTYAEAATNNHLNKIREKLEDQEYLVLMMTYQGYSNTEIAQAIDRSTKTVQRMRKSIKAKLA